MADLFRIETDRLLLVWGSARGGESASSGDATAPAENGVLARREGLRFGPQTRWTPPRLAEHADYRVFLRSTTAAPVSIEHRDPALLRDLESLDGGSMMHGRINFGSQVGFSTFTVCVDGEPELEFGVEVYPTKLDYAADYERLLADTEEIQTALVLEYLRSTFRLGRAVRVGRSTHLEWLTLLRNTADEVERALGQIARHPRWGLAREPLEVRAGRVRRPDSTLRRAVMRGQGIGQHLPLEGGLSVRERLEEHRARPTLDTPEHRWLAAQLRRIRRRLAGLRRMEADRPLTPRRLRTLEEIDALEARISRLSRIEPLRAAERDPSPGFASLQLLLPPGYREAYRACLMLSLGLGAEGGPVELSVKDLHLIYEQWCFLTLVRLLAEATGKPLPARQLLAGGENGLRVLLRRGGEHRVRFRRPGGVRILLTYNPRFGGEPLLVPQQPDMLLEIRSPGEPPVRVVLDAKYRIDGSTGYTNRYGSQGPPEDAINQLHRYRDAILDRATSDRSIAQAIALFPYREAAPGTYRGSRLWRSIERIGIGAIPLLPGSTEYLEGWVRGLIGEQD